MNIRKFEKLKKRKIKRNVFEKLDIFLEALTEDFEAKQIFGLSDIAIREFREWQRVAVVKLAKTKYKNLMIIRELPHGVNLNFKEMSTQQKTQFRYDLVKLTAHLIANGIEVFGLKGSPSEMLIELGKLTITPEIAEKNLRGALADGRG